MPQNKNQIYQFKLRLKDVAPMIWRRFLIRSDSTLKDLHHVIQILMGWTNYHLNEFSIKGKKYTVGNQIGNMSGGGHYGSDMRLYEFQLRKNDKFLYNYDFMANWDFELRLESINPPQEKKFYPICISGSGTSPDEECGGPERFRNLRNYWEEKYYEVMIDFLNAIVNEKNSNKRISDVFDMAALKNVCYWSKVDQYQKKQEANQFLELYAKGDDRWYEAFAEVIYI